MARPASAAAWDGPVVVLGGINMDIQGRSAASFRPGDSNPGEISTSPGGVGRNIAENLVRLGFSVELVTALGDDGMSRQLETSCEDLGVRLDGALRLPRTAAPTYLCLLDHDGMLRGAVAAMDAMEALLPSALEDRAGLLDRAACIVVDANLPGPSIEWIARRYGRGKAGFGRPGHDRPLLVLDPVSTAKAPRAASSIQAFDIVKPNLAEARILAGLDGDTDAAAADELAAKLAAVLLERGAGEVQLSLGGKGLHYDGPDGSGGRDRGSIPLPPPPPNLVPRNVSGAGDAACAALVRAHADGLDPADRARLALAAAVLTAASDRTANPDLCPDLLESTARLLFPR